jgi:hypothetical protein
VLPRRFTHLHCCCCVCRFILFIGVYSFIVNNQSMGRFIRYNAMQAVLLDILLM